MLQAQHITQQKNAQDHGVENLILQRSKKFIIAVKPRLRTKGCMGQPSILLKSATCPITERIRLSKFNRLRRTVSLSALIWTA